MKKRIITIILFILLLLFIMVEWYIYCMPIPQDIVEKNIVTAPAQEITIQEENDEDTEFEYDQD